MTKRHVTCLLPAFLAALFLQVGCNGGGGDDEQDTAEDVQADDAIVEQEEEASEDSTPDPAEEDAIPDTIEEDVVEEELVIELEWGACDTSEWPNGYPYPPAGVECTTIDVPLDYDEPGGETIELLVARHRSRFFPTGRAVFNFAGGPGGTSVGQSGTIPIYIPQLRDFFDLVYVDQRGTGGSGYMDCPTTYPETVAEWRDCANRYSDVDLNHYMTKDAAHDVNYVRRALGYDRIFIRGGSYGTRLGLEYMRQHGETVVAAVLDGLVPPEMDMFGESIPIFDHGIDLLVTECEADPDCLAVSPTLLANLTAWRVALAETPRPILVDGSPSVEDEELYLMFLGAFLRTAQWRFKVPAAIHLAVEGDNEEWNNLMSAATGYRITDPERSMPPEGMMGYFIPCPKPLPQFILGREYMAQGLFMTIVCGEWIPNMESYENLLEITAGQTWGDGEPYLTVVESCEHWDVDPIDEALLTPVSSDLPTLLLSGEIDLNTLAEWGDRAAETLPNSTHVVIPHATHSTVSIPCAASILSQFFTFDGNMDEVDTSCLGAIAHPGW